MGLLSTEIEVKLSGQNIKHYENLGYEIPRVKNEWGKTTVPRGSTIIVKIKDLPKGSSVKIKYTCDCCGKELVCTCADYNKHDRDGKHYCNKCANKILNSGENNPNWNKNLTDEERNNSRSNDEYTKLVKNVLIRDRYTCQCCKQYSKDLKVHHMNSFDIYIDERYDINNMITLCKNCHCNFHKKYGYGNNTKEQFLEWMGLATLELQSVNELSSCKEVYCIEDDKIYSSYKDIMKETGCSKGSIINICNRYHLFLFDMEGFKNYSVKTMTLYGKKYIYLCDYEKANKDDLQKLIHYVDNLGCKRKVKCKELDMVFDSIKDAAKYINMKIEAGINNCCRNKQAYAGKMNGIKLTWEYVESSLNDGSFIMQK